MRRLANHSRDDAYASSRDYQTIHDRQSVLLTPKDDDAICSLQFDIGQTDDSACVGAGGYFAADRDAEIELVICTSSARFVAKVLVGPSWCRAGIAVDLENAQTLMLELAWPHSVALHVWGLSAAELQLPDGLDDAEVDSEQLSATHLCPETLYLQHDSAICIELNPESSSSIHMTEGQLIKVKKCSYCGRILPVDPDRLGALAFHKHNAKVSKHQNECRACKKWRINDEFNPARTTDQLHESSVITRERKLFLREPEILQRIKKRTGEGLKSQVWERFGRKCFVCDKSLRLEDVQLDHTRPLAYLWPLDEHATCLCAVHNNQKTDKFPVEFYNGAKLRRLSKVCGLSIKDLKKREVNAIELERLRADLPTFAREWNPRTFAATARKISELHPEISLMRELETQDPELAEDLRSQLAERPDSDEDV